MDYILSSNTRYLGDYFTSMGVALSQGVYRSAMAATRFLETPAMKMEFNSEINEFVLDKMKVIKNSAASTDEKLAAIQDLKKEQGFLDEQMRWLRIGKAQLYAAIEFTQENNVISYVLRGVGVIAGTLQFALGVSIIGATGWTGAGAVAGAALMIYGASVVEENVTAIIRKDMEYKGIARRGFESTADILGYDAALGSLVYDGLGIPGGGYSLYRMVLKADSWRLFRFINSDYVRRYQQMNGYLLGIQVGSNGWKLYSTIKKYQENLNTTENYQCWKDPMIQNYFANKHPHSAINPNFSAQAIMGYCRENN